MQTEIKKLIQKGMNISRDKYGDGGYPEDFDEGFKAGAKFILELPELREAVEALKFYRQYSDCVEDCRSRSDSWVLKCNCGFVAKEKEHRQALSKIKALGIVKEGE